MITIILTITTLSITIYYAKNYIRYGSVKNQLYPPFAPQRIPLFGHTLHFIKPISVQEVFRLWSLQVGSVFTVQLGSKYWVVLNSVQAVKDLIVERSTIYSSRDLPSTLVDDIMAGVNKGGAFAFYPYGPEWRHLRRIAHGGLVKRKINDYQSIFNERRTALLSNIWRNSQQNNCIFLTNFIEHYTMTSILTIAFGNICNFEAGDTRLHEAFALTERAAASFGTREQLTEFFPILKYVLPSRKSEYKDVRKKMNGFYGGLLDEFKAKWENDQHATEECFIKDILSGGELTDLQMMNFITVFVGAGSETTASTLEWMIALLGNDPDIQDKVYKEIEENVGLDRLPEANDERYLPYLQCVIHETLRFRSPAPMAVPHATSENDIYKNWLIPANTTIIINLHAIHKDPIRYPKPDLFYPDRHMDYVQRQLHQQTQRFSQTIEDRPHLAFSTGRRVCVGIHLAERSIFMAASALLACFRFERESMDLIDIDTPKDIRSPTLSPSPYKIKVIPRHDHVDSFLTV
ncbi:cytochrome P450, partial [Halteromyces radiatus]|uniref:cytochrome P450 n=1 Tax=Halteromyces radiatus TaxID=101107 RepID=UPI00221F830D